MKTISEKYWEDTAWKNADVNDLWIFDKLIVARKMGYVCGPIGVDTPLADNYIIRPCVNILGMSRNAEFVWIEKDTTHLPSGFFWCEIFRGRHLSIDYKNGQQVLAVEGFRNSNDPLWKFSKWQKVKDNISIPQIFTHLTNKYEYINIEYIDGNPIEIHLRPNHDFIHGNTVAYPVWDSDNYEPPEEGLEFWNSPDYKRKGFWIN